MERLSGLSVSFYCRNSKAGKKGTAPLEMGINLNGGRVFVNLPMKVKPEDFNKRRPADYITNYCNEIRLQVNTIVTDMLANNIPLTANNLRDYFRTGGVKSYTVGDMIDGFLGIKYKEMLAGRITKEHYRKYEYARDILLGYVKRENEVTVIVPSLLQNIYADLRLKYKTETTAGQMTKIKAIVRYAYDNGKLQVNPLQGLKVEKGKPVIEFLTKDEVDKLVNTHLPCPTLERVKDTFLFACGSGISYSDCCTLTPDDFKVENGITYITKERNKTGIDYTSVLLPFAADIAKKYNYDIASQMLSNQKTNYNLKSVQSICGITRLQSLHFHLGRKTYATYLLNKGVRVDAVSKAIGHSSVKLTESTYSKFLTSTLISEISKAI